MLRNPTRPTNTPDSYPAQFPVVLTKGCSDSGSLRKSSGVTLAGVIGAGPFSFNKAVPVELRTYP
jgi:hypothetical protein